MENNVVVLAEWKADHLPVDPVGVYVQFWFDWWKLFIPKL